jgi:AraC family transcriptional regulator
MKPDIQVIPALKVVYVRHFGEYGPEIKNAWEKLMSWAKENVNIDASTMFLVAYWDDPKSTLPEKCRSDACITVPEDLKIPENSDIKTQSLPTGKYAMFLKSIYKTDEYQKIWEKLCSEDIPNNNLKWDNRPWYEIYHNCPYNILKRTIVDFCIPIE